MDIEWRDLPTRTLVSVTWFVVQVLLLVRIRSGVLVKSMSSFSWGCRVGAGRSNRRTWGEKGESIGVMKICGFPLKEAAHQINMRKKLVTTQFMNIYLQFVTAESFLCSVSKYFRDFPKTYTTAILQPDTMRQSRCFGFTLIPKSLQQARWEQSNPFMSRIIYSFSGDEM